MARLSIGVDVSGTKAVTDLENAVGKLTGKITQLDVALAKSGKGPVSLKQAVTELTTSFRQMGASADKAFSNLSGLINGTSAYAQAIKRISGYNHEFIATQRAKVVAYEKLVGIEQAYVSALAAEKVASSSAAAQMQAKTAAINAQVAAYKQLAAAGLVTGRYKKGTDYTGELAEIERMKRSLKELEQQFARTASNRAALGLGNRGGSAGYASQMNAEAALYDDKGRLKYAINNMKDYEAAMKQASVESAVVARAANTGATSVGALGDNFHRAAKGSRAFHDAMRGASGAMGALWMTYGQMAPLMAGFAVTASTMATISKGAEFDFLTRSIQKLSGEGYESVGALQAIQKELMGMQGLVHTPAQLASGMLEFARAGIPAAQAVKDMAEVSKFSFLGEMDMGKTVETIVGLMSAFKQSSATPALNQIAVIADATSVSLQQMAEAFKNTTSLGTVMGLSLEDVALSIGVLGQAGVRGATAGAALNTMMYKLAAPTATTKRKMDELGTSFDVFDSATGKIKPLVQIAEELAEMTRSMNPKQRAGLFESMVGLRGIKALGAMVDMARNGSAEFERLKKAIKEVVDTQPGDASSYLAKYYDLVAVSGKVQLQVLKADLDRLFTANYDNASVVNAVKELQKLINEPGTAKVLEGITASVIKLTSTFLYLANAVGSVITLFNKLPGAKFISWFGSEGLAFIEGKLKGVEKFIDFLAGKASTLINILPTAAQKGLGLEGTSKTLADFSNKQGALKPTVELEQLAKYYDLLESIDKQAEGINKRKIDLINEERLANMAQLKASLSGVTQTQEEFNERLHQGKERIDALADAKIVEALKKDLSAAMAEWDAYFIDVLAISTRTVDESAAAAVRTVAVTADAMEAIANKARSVSQQMAADAYASAQQAGQSAIAGAWNALKAGVAGYASEVSKSLSATGGGMTQEGNKAFEMLERKMALYKAQGMAEDMKPSAKLRGAQGAAIVRETAQYAELDATLQKYLLTKSEMDAVANKTGAAKGYKGSAFSAELVAQAPEQVRKYIDLVTDKTVEGISGIYGPRVQKALEAENKKALSDATRGLAASRREDNEELKRTVASFNVYVEGVKDAISATKEWARTADQTLVNSETYVKDHATDGMTRIERQYYDQQEAIRDTTVTMEEHQAQIVKTQEVLRELGSMYGEAVAKLQAFQTKMAGGGLGLTDDQVADKTKSLQNAIEEIRKQFENATDIYGQLIGKFPELEEASLRAQAVIADVGPWDALQKGAEEAMYSTIDRFEDLKWATENVFDSMTDALVDFVVTGKAEIGDLVNSILADLARIAIKESITGPLAGALGGLLKGMVGGVNMGTYNDVSALTSNSKLFATGGVINSPGLSAYSNSVVTKPTFFPFASGMGLMGEAGPEAILPLKRTANGNLGVESVGNGTNVVVNIIESPTKGGQQQQRTDNGVNILDIFVDRVKSAVAADISNGSGAIPNSIQSTYGLNRATGGY